MVLEEGVPPEPNTVLKEDVPPEPKTVLDSGVSPERKTDKNVAKFVNTICVDCVNRISSYMCCKDSMYLS